MHAFKIRNPLLALPALLATFLLAVACGGEAPSGTGSTSSPATPTEAPPETTVNLQFIDDHLAPDTFQVKHGHHVTLNLNSDRDGTLHVHGYDHEIEIVEGGATSFEFEANATGRYPINFHGEPAGAGDAGTGHDHERKEAASPVGLTMDANYVDGGIHVTMDTEGWTWAPEEVNAEFVEGQGHAHIYVNGDKVDTVLGPYYFVQHPEPGSHEVRISLNNNDHSEVTWQGEVVAAAATVVVPDDAHHGHDHEEAEEPVAATAPMSVAIHVHADPTGGYSVQAVPTGFEFAGQAGASHADGVGYVALSINGEHYNRMYGPWLRVGALGEGQHTLTVALLTNDGHPYHHNGQPVAASIDIHEAAAAEDSGHDHSHDHSHDHEDGAEIEEFEVGYLEVLP